MLKELKDCFPIEQLEGEPLRKWFDFLYNLLFEKYRCEYVYKNILVNQLYMRGEHIPQNSTLISELRVCHHNKADIVIINGKSTVYEIKSKYDSLNRLESQIATYKKVFDRIYVVTCAEKNKSGGKRSRKRHRHLSTKEEKTYKKLERQNPTRRIRFRSGFSAVCTNRNIYQFSMRSSFIHHLTMCGCHCESRKMFCQLDPVEAHDAMVRVVRKRKNDLAKPYVDLVCAAPESLKHSCLSFCSRTQEMVKQVRALLEEPFRI